MAPVSSDLLHSINHRSWCSIIHASLDVMCHLVTAPGETGTEVSREISGNMEAICAVQKTLQCRECEAALYIPAIKILTHLPPDTPWGVPAENRENLIKTLVDIFTDNNRNSDTRGLAGEKLAMLSSESKSDGAIILRANNDVVRNLAKVLIKDKSKTCRVSAAGILEGLYNHYTNNDSDDKCLEQSKEVLIHVMPKVLQEVTSFGSTEKGMGVFSARGTDIEGQQGGVSQASDGGGDTSSKGNKEKQVETKLAFMSFSVAVCDNLITADEDLNIQFDVLSFLRKLKDMVERHNRPTANCLRLMKLTSKLVMSMMKHKDTHINQDLESLMISLSIASQNMSDIDGLMLLCSSNDGPNRIFRTLTSLVKEAQELMDKKKAQESTIVPVSTKGNLLA